MVRLAFLELLLFLTPFIAFALWRLSMQATAEIAEHQPAPVWILSAVGGFLAAAGFVLLVFMSDTGDSEHSTYIPPRLGADGIERAEFNNQPGQAPPQDSRNFGEPSDHTVTTDLDEEEDDADPPSPR